MIDELQGPVAQGRTIQETIEIAHDLARNLIYAQSGVSVTPLTTAGDALDYRIIIASLWGHRPTFDTARSSFGYRNSGRNSTVERVATIRHGSARL